MDCEKIHLLIENTISGKASQHDQHELAAHIESCGDCLVEYENAVLIHKTIKSVSDSATPAGLPDKVLEIIKAQKAIPESAAKVILFPAPLRLAGGIVALAAAVAALFLIPSWMAPNGTTTPANIVTVTPTPTPTPIPIPEAIEFQCRATAVKGEVLVMSGDSWKNLSEEAGLTVGSVVKTNAGSNFTMVYPDGASIRVKPGSELTVRLEAIMLKQGATWLRITRRGSRFEVHTPNAIAGVMGTRFGVCAMPGGGSCVSLFEGKVWVGAGNVAGDSVHKLVLEPGQKVSIAENGLVSPVFKTAKGEEAAWAVPSTILTDFIVRPNSGTLSTDATGQAVETAAGSPASDSAATGPRTENRPKIQSSDAKTHYDTMSGLDNDDMN